MSRLTHLDTSDITIPDDIIVRISDKRINLISNSFGTESEVLFFVIVTKTKDNVYCLVDRYDVYLAAKKNNCKHINALIILDSDNLQAQIALSQKHLVNPASVVRLISPFVEKHGLEKTMQMFYLDSSFGKMYDANLDDDVMSAFESLINHAYEIGIRSVVPVQLFAELPNFGSIENQIELLKNMEKVIDIQRAKFRWPHKEHLSMLAVGTPTRLASKKEKKAETPARFFDCSKCGAAHTVTPDHIGPK